MGRNMDAIVVDTEATGRECIKYLKEQRFEPETFIPLDSVRTKPLNETLREIRQPYGVKLVFDVIKFEPPAIKKALLYACGNALVCESTEDARQVAFSGNQRLKAVSLNGTMFEKSGILSGGLGDLKAKARRWDEKALTNLKNRKEELLEELKEMQKSKDVKRKESDLTTIKSSIGGLENRIKYSKNDYESTKEKHIKANERDIMNRKSELELFEPRILEIQDRMEARAAQIVKIKDKRNKVEDEIFADFCAAIGVENIRQYEEKELKSQQDRAKKRLEFENQKSRLQNQLAYERFVLWKMLQIEFLQLNIGFFLFTEQKSSKIKAMLI